MSSRWPDPAAGGPQAARAVGARAWGRLLPWLLAAIAATALGLVVHVHDLLEHRLEASSARFGAALRQAERLLSLHDDAVESALALRQALATPRLGTAPDLAAAKRRFGAALAALDAEVDRPSAGASAWAGAWHEHARRMQASVALLPDAPGADAASRLAARWQVGQLLGRLAQLDREARLQQLRAEGFRDEVEQIRRQVLLTLSAGVAVFLLTLGLATHWVLAARKERGIRRRAEDLARQAEAERRRAQEVANDKSRFLGMLSHELLTPLQSILSTMDVIEARGRVAAGEAAFTRLRESTRLLHARLGDLIDFAKVSSGRLETHIRGFRLDRLIEAALRDQEEALASRGLDMHWEPGPDLADPVYADPARLRQIVDNVLGNAVKYTERGGVTLTARVDRVAGWLRLEVIDTGVGIPESVLARLFEPFYRVPATAGRAPGSGLGLAVSRSLAELMGGQIELRSAPGVGTRVTVVLPIAAARETVAPAVRLGAPATVLVVDDAPDARAALADVLRAAGVEVLEAADGAEALALAAARDFQAILIDQTMPGLSGDAVARQWRAPGNRHERTFIALVSACPPRIEPGTRDLFDARLDKPVARHELLALLSRSAAGRPGQAPGSCETG